MSFYADNNKIEITDSSSNIIFNTDRKMPSIIDVLEGSIVIPARGNTTSQTVVMHTIGTTNASCNFILADSYIDGGSSYPWTDTHFNASGSVISNLGWQDLGGLNWRIGAGRTITFEINNGSVQLREEYYNLFNTLQLASFTLSYKLYIGRFD